MAMKLEQTNEQVTGIVSAVGAYALWGILPVYWKFVHNVPSQEILAHRIVWSFFFMVFVLLVTAKLRAFISELFEIIVQPKKLLGIMMAAALVSVNWFTYIWAVNNNHVIESSLGYYINPLISVLLGIIVLKEKLSLWQIVSFFLATIGVLNMTLRFGSVPWVALILAISFGLYGLIKKVVNAGAITGLTLETLFISPFALIFLRYVHNNGNGAFGLDSPITSSLLIGAGVITAVPLLLFAGGAKRLPLSVIGFLQYIAPTLMLILGVFIYHEPFTGVHLSSFVFIWTALIIFSLAKTKSFIRLESMLFKKITLEDKKTA